MTTKTKPNPIYSLDGCSENDLYKRAVAALYRTDDIPQQPDAGASGVEEHGGKIYVVLRNVRGVVACYRVRNDGKLKRLVRLPPEIAAEADTRDAPPAPDANGMIDSDQMLRYAVTGAIKQDARRAAEPAARRSIGNDKLPDMTGTLALFRKKR